MKELIQLLKQFPELKRQLRKSDAQIVKEAQRAVHQEVQVYRAINFETQDQSGFRLDRTYQFA